jgi:hypothetical protein
VSTLPVRRTDGHVQADLATLPVGQRASVRRTALGYSPDVLAELKRLAEKAEKDRDRIAAGKVVLAVAALLSSTNIPRDVVKEKFELTVESAEKLMADDQFNEFCGALASIWSDV